MNNEFSGISPEVLKFLANLSPEEQQRLILGSTTSKSSGMGMQMSWQGIINTLRDNLLNRYKSEFCILQELIQNADDAQARKILVGIAPTLSNKHPLLSAPALFIVLAINSACI